MMTPGRSHRFFTTFYDALSPLLKAAPPSPLAALLRRRPPQLQCNAHAANRRRSFTALLPTSKRQSYLPLRISSQIKFFSASFTSTTAASVWTPRSRYVVSRGFAGFCVCTSVPVGAGPTSTTTTTTTAAASAVIEKSAGVVGAGLRWYKGGHSAGLGFRALHSPPRRKGKKARGGGDERKQLPGSAKPSSKDSPSIPEIGGGGGKAIAERKKEEGGKPESTIGIFERVSHIHRPTKDEMLAAATGAWQRLRIRAKWSLIRQMRPYSLDDIGAFFSWLLLGHIVWVVVGTTTFLSVAIFLVNSVSAQETLAGFIGNYLTRETGVTVVFESAIVPRWKDNCIQFKKVFVSRRPGQGKHTRNVSKGSAETAAAAAAAAIHIDGKEPTQHVVEEDEGANFTQFDLTVETVNVTLSFARWMNGRGLLKDVEIKGVRGVIDRTHVFWEGIEPQSLKHEHSPGDFEIESFKLEDLLVTVYLPDGFRPFPVSIYSCDLPQLRKQWLFYDFLSANNCSGSFDDSLFTIHPRQSHNALPGNSEMQNPWKKTSRLRIDGLEVDHLNRGIEGPFSWIQQGNVDIIADVSFPLDDDLQFSKLVHDIYEHMESTINSSYSDNVHHDFASVISSIGQIGQKDKEGKFLVMDLHVQLNDVRAAVPIFNKDLSYVNNAMIRPIVAYVNSRKTYIPINCRVVKELSEFDGSWTVYDSGLMDDLSAETYEAFSRNVADEQARRRRIRKVGLWSLQLLAQAFLMAMAGSVA